MESFVSDCDKGLHIINEKLGSVFKFISGSLFHLSNFKIDI